MKTDVIYRYLYYPNKQNVNLVYFFDNEIKNDALNNPESCLWLLFPVQKLYFTNKVLGTYNLDNAQVITLINKKFNSSYMIEPILEKLKQEIYEFELVDNKYIGSKNGKLLITLDAFAFMCVLCQEYFYLNYLNLKYFGVCLVYCAIQLGILTSTTIKQEEEIENNNKLFKIIPEYFASTELKIQKKVITSCIERKNILITGTTGVGKTKIIPKLIYLFNLYFIGYNNIDFKKIESIYDLKIFYKTTYIIAPKKILIKAIAKNIYTDLGFKSIKGSPVKISYKREIGDSSVNDDINYSYKKFRTPLIAAIGTLALRSIDDAETIMIDEIHEHSEESDIIALVAKKLKKQLVLISATIDTELAHIKTLFPNIVHIHIEGETRFKIDSFVLNDENEVFDIIDKEKKNKEAILWFLPTKAKITSTQYKVESNMKNIKCFPLYSLVYQEYLKKGINITDEIENNELPSLVLSTNLAESSITIKNASVVIDSGEVYVKKFYDGSVETINEQMSLQRKGRVGRVASGKYYYYGKPFTNINKLDYTFLYKYILCNLYFNLPIDSFFLNPTDMSRVKKSIDYLKKKHIDIEQNYEQVFYIVQNEFCSLFEYVYLYMNCSHLELNVLRELDKSLGDKYEINRLFSKYKPAIIKFAKMMNLELSSAYGAKYVLDYHFEDMPAFHVSFIKNKPKTKQMFLIYPGIGLVI